jgi:hypothetical protein
VASRRRPSIGKVVGPPGTRTPRLLELRPNRYLVVSDAPLDSFGEASLAARLSDLDWVSRAAVAHDAVVERFISADAVLPMKVFTIFTSDERAIAKTRSDWDRIESLLKDVTGQAEWGLRLMFDQQNAPMTPTPRTSTGRSYLLAKRKQRTETVAHRRLVHRRTAGVVTALAAIARDVRQRPLATAATTGSRLLLDAAFLVPRTRERRFRAAVARETRRLTPEGYAVHLSGPWPPYSFIESA